MGLFAPAFERRSQEIGGGTSTNPHSWMIGAVGGGPTVSGQRVSIDSVDAIPALWACVDLGASLTAQLPLKLFEQLEKGKQPAQEHPLYEVLHDAANPDMSAFDFRYTMQRYLMTWSNAFAEIIRDTRGRAKQLWPLKPWYMKVGRTASKALLYSYEEPGQQPRRWVRDPNRPSILHLRFDAADGIMGRSLIRRQREAIGATLAAQDFGARWFGSGSRPSGVLTVPKDVKLRDGEPERVLAEWERLHRGAGNAHKTALLQHGMTWVQTSLPPGDAEFVAQQRFNAEQMCWLYRTPPHMIGLTEKVSSWGTGIEQQTLGFINFSMMRWWVCWQQGIKLDCLGPVEFKRYEPLFVVNSLVKGDINTRYKAYQIGIDKGIWSPDEVRAFEDANPRDDGLGGLYYQTNMVPAGVPVTEEPDDNGLSDMGAPGQVM